MAVSKALRLKILERDNYTCVLCHKNYRSRPMTLEIDHRHPVKEGGTNEERNLRTLCLECNRTKSSKCPECPNCGKAIDLVLPACAACGFPIHGQAIPKRDPVRTIARWVLLIVGISLLTFSLGRIAWNYGSNLISRLRGTDGSVTAQTAAGGAACKVSDSNGRANLKTKCDSLDCDNDPSTVAGKIANGTSVTKTGNVVSSGLPSVGEWVGIQHNGQAYFVASAKIVCP